ncbi:MAG: ParB/RepB/Spo0J family partition protein [Cellvibrionaceae bacterium]
MAKRKGLGKGLGALMKGASVAASAQENTNTLQAEAAEDISVGQAVEAVTSNDRLRDLPVEFLQRGKYQPRRDMHPEALEELAESIRAQGVMQPIVVRPINKGSGEEKYEIIAGERRWRASQLAELEKVPCVIRDVPDEAAVAMALIENIQREDLNPIEEAMALQRLQREFELTHQEVAEAVGKSRTTVTNLLRLMNLPDDVRTMLEHGDLEMGHARCLLTLDADQARNAARQVVSRGLSVRQTEALVRRLQQEKESPTAAPQKLDPDIKALQDKLSETIGVPVQIQHGAKGKGKLVLKYSSLDELDGILNHIK